MFNNLFLRMTEKVQDVTGPVEYISKGRIGGADLICDLAWALGRQSQPGTPWRIGISPKEIWQGEYEYDEYEDGYDAADYYDEGIDTFRDPSLFGETSHGDRLPPINAHPPPSRPASTPSPSAQSNWWYHRVSEISVEQGVGYSPGDQIETRVVGVTFEGRQAVVAQLSLKEQIWLRREPRNPHDRNAIRVERQNGRQIGYISRDIAAILAHHFDNYGKPVSAVVTALVGGEPPYSSRGVRMRFNVPEPPPPVDDSSAIPF